MDGPCRTTAVALPKEGWLNKNSQFLLLILFIIYVQARHNVVKTLSVSSYVMLHCLSLVIKTAKLVSIALALLSLSSMPDLCPFFQDNVGKPAQER